MRHREDETAFNQRTDTGARGYRLEHEAPDDRPLVIYPSPQFKSASERLHYEDVVERTPRKPVEGQFSYIARLSETATCELRAGKKLGGTPDWIEDHA